MNVCGAATMINIRLHGELSENKAVFEDMLCCYPAKMHAAWGAVVALCCALRIHICGLEHTVFCQKRLRANQSLVP
jgi:hypothetical protein